MGLRPRLEDARTSSPTSCSSTSRTSAPAFTNRFKQLGGTIVDSESFTQGDKTINNVATRINGKPAQMIAFCTSFGTDQPAFVSSLRTLGNKTPIMNSWAG